MTWGFSFYTVNGIQNYIYTKNTFHLYVQSVYICFSCNDNCFLVSEIKAICKQLNFTECVAQFSTCSIQFIMLETTEITLDFSIIWLCTTMLHSSSLSHDFLHDKTTLYFSIIHYFSITWLCTIILISALPSYDFAQPCYALLLYLMTLHDKTTSAVLLYHMTLHNKATLYFCIKHSTF